MHKSLTINEIKKAFHKLEPELAELEKNKAFILFLDFMNKINLELSRNLDKYNNLLKKDLAYFEKKKKHVRKKYGNRRKNL